MTALFQEMQLLEELRTHSAAVFLLILLGVLSACSLINPYVSET